MKSSIFTLFSGGIGLLLICLLLYSNNHIDPSWGKWWQLKPLVIVPLGSAFAGRIIYYIHPKKPIEQWKMLLFVLGAVVFFCMSCWISIIVGLDGTLWN